MATEQKVNKSQAIRECLAKNGMDTTFSDVQAEMEAIGVNGPMFSLIKGKVKAGKQAKKDAKTKAKAEPKLATPNVSLDDAVKFVQECGGIKQAQANVEALEAEVAQKRALIAKVQEIVKAVA